MIHSKEIGLPLDYRDSKVMNQVTATTVLYMSICKKFLMVQPHDLAYDPYIF